MLENKTCDTKQFDLKIRIVKLINQSVYLSMFENIFIKNDNEIIHKLPEN